MKSALALVCLCVALLFSSCGGLGTSSQGEGARLVSDGGGARAKQLQDGWWTVSIPRAQDLYLRARKAEQAREYELAGDLVLDSIEMLGKLPEQNQAPESLQLLRHLDKLASELRMTGTATDLWSRRHRIRNDIYKNQSSPLTPRLAAELEVTDDEAGGGLAGDKLLDSEDVSPLKPEETAGAAALVGESGGHKATSTPPEDSSISSTDVGVRPGLESILAGADQELLNGHPEAAATVLEEGLKSTSAGSGPGDPLRIQAQLNLAKIHLARGYLEEARSLLREVLASMEARGAIDERQRDDARGALADTLLLQGEYSGASDVQEAQFESRSKRLGEQDSTRIALGDRLVSTYMAAGDFGRARALGEELMEQRSHTLDPHDPLLGERHLQLARASELSGDLPGAFAHLERYIRDFLREGQAGGTGRFSAHRDIARVLEGMGQHEKARSHLDRYLAYLNNNAPAWDQERDNTRESEARVAKNAGDLPAARSSLEELLEDYPERYPPDHPRLQMARRSLARVLAKQGDGRAAEALQAEAFGSLSHTLPGDDPRLNLARSEWIALMVEIDDVDGALRELEELLNSAAPNAGPNMSLAQMRLQAARLQRACQLPEAIAMREKIVDRDRATFFPGHPLFVEDTRELAALLRVAGRAADARGLEQRFEGYPATPGTLQEHWGMALNVALESVVAPMMGPRITLSEPLVAESGEVHIEATIRDAGGIRNWTVFQDGLERPAPGPAAEWVGNSGGTGGRLRITLSMPEDAAVTLVEVSASNFDGLRGVKRVAAARSLLPGESSTEPFLTVEPTRGP